MPKVERIEIDLLNKKDGMMLLNNYQSFSERDKGKAELNIEAMLIYA